LTSGLLTVLNDSIVIDAKLSSFKETAFFIRLIGIVNGSTFLFIYLFIILNLISFLLLMEKKQYEI
jgi:hypothetical protein